MKRLLTCTLLLLLFLPLNAGKGSFMRRLHPGLEWGAGPTLCDYHHYNYLDEYIGFRIDEKGWDFTPHANAFVLASISFDFNPKLNFRLLCGLEGINKGRRASPLSARAAFYPRTVNNDGIFVFAEGQTGIFREDRKRNVAGGQAGAGYRIALTPRTSLNLQAGFRVMYDNPDVWDPLEEEYISERNIKLSEAWYSALNFSVALEF